MSRRCVLGAVIASMLSVTPVHALLVSGSYHGWDSGHYYDLHAEASFTIVDKNLEVILTNTSPADVTVPTDVLTAVFFKLPGNPNLKRVSAVLNTGSTVNGGTTDPGGVVGGEWAYKNSLSGKYPSDGAVNQGISSSGLSTNGNDMFGPKNLFPGKNLEGPSSPDGVQYGITSAGDEPSTGNGGISGQALIQNSVKFVLGNLPGSIHESDITNVWFQYGTSLCELHFPGVVGPPSNQGPVPEPLTILCCALGLVSLRRYACALPSMQS